MDNKIKAGDVLEFIAIVGDRTINSFMEGFGLKPEHKVYVTQQKLKATVGDFSDLNKLPEEMPQHIFDKLKEALDEKFILVYFELVGSEKNFKIVYNNKKIKEISDGEKCCFINCKVD